MPMPRSLHVLLGAALLLPLSESPFAASLLDSRFDHNGIRRFDVGPARDGNTIDLPIVTCPTAGNGQLVVVRKGGTDIISTRLRFDGSIDASFGDGGTRLVALPTTARTDGVSAAVCRPDGSAWIAVSGNTSDGDTNVRLLAIAADGETVPGFVGVSGGIGDLDLDNLRSDLLTDEVPLGMNQTPDGGALVTGYATTTQGHRPFLVRLGADSRVQHVSFPLAEGLHGNIVATAAAIGPGGQIWVVGDGQRTGYGRTAFRMVIDPVSREVLRTDLYSLGADFILTAGGGLIRDGVMVVGASRRSGGNPAQPMLLVLRSDGISSLALPAPPPLAPGLSTGIAAQGNSILWQPGGRLLYAIGAQAFDGTVLRGPKGWYFARAYIGADAAGDRVDPTFGEAGRAVLSVASGHPTCAGKLNTQVHARIGVWAGMPTVIGNMQLGCDPDFETDAVMLRLMAADGVFAHGFE